MFYKPLFYVIQFIYDFLYLLPYMFQTISQLARLAQSKNDNNPHEQTKFILFLRIHTCLYLLNTC